MQEKQILSGGDTKAKVSWSLFDFANSAFTTVIITFVFATYFSQAIAPTEEVGARWWGWCMAGSGVFIAVLSPILGAIADRTGQRKPWILFFTLMCVVPTFALWWVQPAADGGLSQTQLMIIAIVLVGLANIGFEMGAVFNNSMLPDVVPQSSIGRWSGFAWGLGYIGGLLSLVLCLALFVDPTKVGLDADLPTTLFGLDKALGEHIRITSPVIAVWVGVFALPLFLFTPDKPRGDITYKKAIRDGMVSLQETLIDASKNKNLFRFLIAHLFYRDGLNTLLQMGGIFAGAVFGIRGGDLIIFAILLNVTAALGAFIFAWLDDKFGSKKIIMFSVACMFVTCCFMLTATTKFSFYVTASILGLFVGSIQSSSRTMIGRIAPPGKVTETYGLFAFSGKSTSFIGPLLVGELTYLFDSHRIGMGSLLILVAIGFVVLWKVSDKQPT